MKSVFLIQETIHFEHYIRMLIPTLTYSQLQMHLRKRNIVVKNNNFNIKSILKPNDIVYIWNHLLNQPVSSLKLTYAQCSFFIKNILAQDENYWVINKVYGLPSQGGTNVHYSLIDVLETLMAPQKPYIVHRLDKDTTGVMLIATNPQTARLIQETKWIKQYVALIDHPLDTCTGIINTPVNDKDACTKYSILSQVQQQNLFNHTWPKNYSVILFELLTGRKHQIRQHVYKEFRCGIVGDSRYNPRKQFKQKMCLHAYKMQIFNKTFIADLPAHFYL